MFLRGEQRLASSVERSELSTFNSSSWSAAEEAVMRTQASSGVSSAVEAAVPPGRDIGIAPSRRMTAGNDRLQRLYALRKSFRVSPITTRMEHPNMAEERALGDEPAGKRQGEACPHPVPPQGWRCDAGCRGRSVSVYHDIA